MKLINPSFKILDTYGYDINGIKKDIERAGRVCYKSEDKITDTSADSFVQMLLASKHTSALEHGAVYLYYTEPRKAWTKENDLPSRYYKNKYSKVKHIYDKECDLEVYYISTNYRVLVENGWLNDLKYICGPTSYHEKRITVQITSDIHYYKDTTRHRVFSWSIESTRWCNYMKEKFGMSVSFIKPSWIKEEDINELEEDCKVIEALYFKWINKGYQPQHAAYFLIQGVKADIVMTGFLSDFKEFFKIRALGSTGKPHPDVLAITQPLLETFKLRGYIEYDELD